MVAVVGGTATPQQAKAAMDWVMREAARVADLAFQLGGEDGRRASDFAEGRQYVGHQIRRLLQPATRKIAEKGDSQSMDDRQAEQVALDTQRRGNAT